MSEISGVNGAVYYNEELSSTATANDIEFSTGDSTITSVLIDFGTTGVGFKAGMLFDLSECGEKDSNERIYTIDTVLNKVITTVEAITSGGACTGTPVFTEYDPGIEICGFYNWTINYVSGIHDVTAFCNSSAGKSFIPSVTEWSATADKYFLTANNTVDDWLATEVEVRFFTKYVASPTVGNPAQYWEGTMLVTGIDETTPVDALVTQNLSFQGKGALTLTTKTNDWNTT